MSSSAKWRRLDLVEANVSEEGIASTLMMEVIRSSETSALTIYVLCHIAEDGILHGYHHENLKSYMASSVSL
jgi:hypothetical protein